MALNPPPKALFFDVFGTCGDWRSTVPNALYKDAQEALESSKLAPGVRSIAEKMSHDDWEALADEWRNSYLTFVVKLATDPSIPYKTVDEHHLDALREILTKRQLLLPDDPAGSLWSSDQIVKLSMIWHYLQPWPDTCAGIAELNKKFTTCTLSNGNLSLLQDMVKNAGMPFTHVFSAEMFQSYKPSSKVYLGGPAKLDLKPEECGMVAAHLGDLKYAKSNGLRTVYVERPGEEKNPELRDEKGIVDVWVTEEEDGFLAAAKKLGC